MNVTSDTLGGSDIAISAKSANQDLAKKAVALMLSDDYQTLMAEAGLTPPKSTYKSFSVMGRVFDPMKPKEYVDSFAIKRA